MKCVEGEVCVGGVCSCGGVKCVEGEICDGGECKCGGVKCGVGAVCFKGYGGGGYECRCYDGSGELCGGEKSECGEYRKRRKCIKCGGKGACSDGKVCKKGKCVKK